MKKLNIIPGWYQDVFLNSQAKFPALISAVGTGKTLCLLTKIYKYCEDYPGTTALVVRKEFTDLRDSTMRDFENYFDVRIGVDKNCRLANGSQIMFRHASEMLVLKNLNLGIVGIEQAEEFEDDTQFQFLRDRMRQENGAKVRPMCIIANANGHNWIWKTWVNEATTVNVIDEKTGQRQYIRGVEGGEYEAITANILANTNNLVPDFIADKMRQETEAPKHFQQYAMNSFDTIDADDFVFSFAELRTAQQRGFAAREGFGYKVMGFDVARFGNDKCAAVGLQQVNTLSWIVNHVEQWGDTDLETTSYRIMDISNSYGSESNIVDEDGIGGGPLDVIMNRRKDFQGFRNPVLSYEKNPYYCNPRTAAAFRVKEMVTKGWIALPSEELIQELATLRYKFSNDGRRILISKDEMRNKYKIKSPNAADAFLMAASLIDDVRLTQARQYDQRWSGGQAAYSQEQDLFKIAGVR